MFLRKKSNNIQNIVTLKNIMALSTKAKKKVVEVKVEKPEKVTKKAKKITEAQKSINTVEK